MFAQTAFPLQHLIHYPRGLHFPGLYGVRFPKRSLASPLKTSRVWKAEASLRSHKVAVSTEYRQNRWNFACILCCNHAINQRHQRTSPTRLHTAACHTCLWEEYARICKPKRSSELSVLSKGAPILGRVNGANRARRSFSLCFEDRWKGTPIWINWSMADDQSGELHEG